MQEGLGNHTFKDTVSHGTEMAYGQKSSLVAKSLISKFEISVPSFQPLCFQPAADGSAMWSQNGRRAENNCEFKRNVTHVERNDWNLET